MQRIGVVSHVSRAELTRSLERELWPDIIEYDNSLPPSVSGCANNHIRVLRHLAKVAHNETWAVVLEDDAQPVPGFYDQLDSALAHADTGLVGLYLGTGNPGGATQRAIAPAVQTASYSNASWIVADWFISTVGYAVRVSELGSLIDYLDSHGGPVDNRINSWTHVAGIETWYTQPSLVDHADRPSLICGTPGVTPVRRAWRVGGRESWSKRTVRMPICSGWSPISE